jgi:hypothetical protein
VRNIGKENAKEKVFTAQQLIEKRKKMWADGLGFENDRSYITAIAKYLLDNKTAPLHAEIKEHPEYLVEMFFCIVDKDKKTLPFFLNDVQKDFIERLNRAKIDYREGKRLHIKFLVLKGRQAGFTSCITAYQLASTISKSNFEGFTAADEDANTTAIFENKAKYVYSMLPDLLKPTEKYNNRKQLLFEELHSSWEIKTASKNMGRSRTINFFHGSESAFWKDGISGVQAGLGEAMTKDAVQILESTANGYNEYKDLWDSGEWENCFYEWWRTPEYFFKFESEQKKKDFQRDVMSRNEWIYERCRWLVKDIKLNWEQAYWYFNKYKGYILKEHIQQEYPCTPDEAFLASGSCIFNKEHIIQRKAYLQELYKKNPPKRGDFIITWNDPERMDYPIAYKWSDNPQGDIIIYQEPEPGHPYCLGGDTKGEGSDWFAATVRNNNNGVRCASIHMQGLKSKPYTAQCWALANYYNQALVGIEVNFNTYPIELLGEWKYPRQYMREKTDSITKEVKKQFGWKTDGNTRPLIIERQITNVEENIEHFFDIETLSEMLTFIKDKDGRYDAEDGKHDDLLFSDMISEAIGSQQTRQVEEIKKAVELFYIDDDGDGTRREKFSDLGGFFD